MKKWEYRFLALGKLLDESARWNEKTMKVNKEEIKTLTALNNLKKQGWEYFEHEVKFHKHGDSNNYVFKEKNKIIPD